MGGNEASSRDEQQRERDQDQSLLDLEQARADRERARANREQRRLHYQQAADDADLDRMRREHDGAPDAEAARDEVRRLRGEADV